MRGRLARTLPRGPTMSRPSSPVSRLLASACVAATVSGAPVAVADPPPPVDVVIREPAPTRRFLTIEYNPLTLIIAKASVNVVIAPIDHHALVLVPFFASTTTAPLGTYRTDANMSTIQLPAQTFKGYGGEIGYRYYSGLGGPRGFFVGPSLLIGSMTATAANGTDTSFSTYGLAADGGYEALVADRIAVSVGAGAEYLATSKSIPNQQLPASLYANGGVWPRVLLAVGCAF
jgi:hypothetical protein